MPSIPAGLRSSRTINTKTNNEEKDAAKINSVTYWPGKKRSRGESFKGGPQRKGENQRGGPVPVASDLRRWLACWKKRASASEEMVGVWSASASEKAGVVMSVDTANLLDGLIEDWVNLNLPADCDCRKMEGEGKRQSALEAIDQKMKINASAAATCASDIYIIYYILLNQTKSPAGLFLLVRLFGCFWCVWCNSWWSVTEHD